MENLGKILLEGNFGHKVMGILTMDKSSKRMSVDTYIISPDGSISDVTTVTRKDMMTKGTSLDFFLDMEGDFTRDNIDSIRLKLKHLFDDCTNASLVQSKATMEEIHRAVTEFVMEEEENLEDNPEADVFIKEEYGYILTEKMDEFVKEYGKQLGYPKRVDILKRLKIMGALQNGNNRPYDILVSRQGFKQRFYKIELAEEASEEQADEVLK